MTLIARGSRRLATVLAVWALAMTAGALVLMVPNSVATLEDLGFNGVGGLMLGTIYPILGWLIATRRPENRIGWMFLVIGLSQSASGFTEMYRRSWLTLGTTTVFRSFAAAPMIPSPKATVHFSGIRSSRFKEITALNACVCSSASRILNRW